MDLQCPGTVSYTHLTRSCDGIEEYVQQLLEDIQNNIYQKALNYRNAVSYTPLDVYKRQVVDRLENLEKYASLNPLFAKAMEYLKTTAVSYTHLDVYKRQPHNIINNCAISAGTINTV